MNMPWYDRDPYSARRQAREDARRNAFPDSRAESDARWDRDSAGAEYMREFERAKEEQRYEERRQEEREAEGRRERAMERQRREEREHEEARWLEQEYQREMEEQDAEPDPPGGYSDHLTPGGSGPGEPVWIDDDSTGKE